MTKALLAALAVCAIRPGMLSAQQVSLEASDVVDDVKFQDNGVDYSVTVYRDARQRSQWYYVPIGPRIVAIKDADTGAAAPEMALVKYQFPDPSNPGSLLEGGLAQFSLVFAVPPSALEQMRQQLSARTGVGADQITIGPLPFTSGTVALYGESDRTFISSTPSGQGVAPTFATQRLAFQVPLTKPGVDVYEELIKGNTGIGIRAEYDYQGLTPPLGFEVEVDWDQTFKHLSKEEKWRAQVSARALFGLFSANVSYNKTNSDIRENLEQNQCIKVNVITGSGFTMEQVDKYLQPLLARISSTLLDQSKPPPTINPAAAEAPGTGNYGFSGGYSVAMKRVELTKKGKEKINFAVRTVVDRKAVVEGFVGIKEYPESVRKNIIRTVAPGQWQAAYFAFPDIGEAQNLGLTSIGAEVALVLNGNTIEQQAATWTPADSWKKVGSAATVKYFTFPLASVFAANGDNAFSRLKFQIKYKLNTASGAVLEAVEERPAVSAASTVPPALNSFVVVEVSPASLNWYKVDNPSDARALNIVLKVDGKEFHAAIAPKNINSAWQPPESAKFLVPTKAKSVKIAMSMIASDGALLKWQPGEVDLEGLKADAPISGVTERLVVPLRSQFAP
ncbi:hypothetical protein [Bradyrhizobium sp. SZCCHNS3002]|uniref:hypothetical protein n=1 Tax=Bradyrhizobium sp. SZCCHNS3002 TaxID=3057310 RepID=UPI0028E8A2C9|nr:hypothetical protein [Bradyrhizobium sp. SZCCHNS3002]